MLILTLELKEKISANQNSSQDSRAQAALVDGRLSKLADCNESIKHERKLTLMLHSAPHASDVAKLSRGSLPIDDRVCVGQSQLRCHAWSCA